ncbi:MAG: hypothetical protein A4E66_00460 [Syntrophus sp. PtaB.Bin001]|nr:MAG: hypothetical protein A4E66_00460 [Syntrophus sp. PtaB.Bin001]
MNGKLDLSRCEGFGKIIHRSLLHGFHSGFNGGIGCNHDDSNPGRRGQQSGNQLHAVGGAKTQIYEGDVEGFERSLGKGVFKVAYRRNAVPLCFQADGQSPADVDFVIDNKNVHVKILLRFHRMMLLFVSLIQIIHFFNNLYPAL